MQTCKTEALSGGQRLATTAEIANEIMKALYSASLRGKNTANIPK